MEGQQNNKIIIKSPGKSLLSGGYLILDKSKRDRKKLFAI